jgi:hypothetical protein
LGFQIAAGQNKTPVNRLASSPMNLDIYFLFRTANMSMTVNNHPSASFSEAETPIRRYIFWSSYLSAWPTHLSRRNGGILSAFESFA